MQGYVVQALVPYMHIVSLLVLCLRIKIPPAPNIRKYSNTIRLRYAMVMDRDDLSYQLTPVWDFVGDAVRSDGTTSYTIEHGRTFLSVDATDGSIIDFKDTSE